MVSSMDLKKSDKAKSIYLILSLQWTVNYVSDFLLIRELKHFNKGVLWLWLKRKKMKKKPKPKRCTFKKNCCKKSEIELKVCHCYKSEYAIIHSLMHSWYQRIVLLCIMSDFSYRTWIFCPKLKRFLQMSRKTCRVIGGSTLEYQYSKLSRKAEGEEKKTYFSQFHHIPQT